MESTSSRSARKSTTPKHEHLAILRAVFLSTSFVLHGTSAQAGVAESVPSLTQEDNAVIQSSEKPEPSVSSDTNPRKKSYVIPALEIVGFEVGLNLVNRGIFDAEYETHYSSIERNLLHRSWVTDNDPYSTNQFGHPYQGSIYHGFARSAGLTYWESLAYTFAGSALWEIAGETTPPSKNDQVASGIAGTFLGEPLFRTANLVLETRGGVPRLWREVAAAIISPPAAFNRLVFPDRFGGIYSSQHAASYTQLQVGGSATTQDTPGASTGLDRNEALLDLSVEYGLPGQPGYTYTRPFDYFKLRTTLSSANGFENIMARGLLFGTDYEAGADYRGVWGLYGSYDYIAPQFFRISSTALSLGTTAEWWLSNSLALQATGLGGAGYAAVGTLYGASEQDYHYGIAPQVLTALRLIAGDRASFEVTARDYYVSGIAATRGGLDNIVRADAAITVRVYHRHALAVRYLWNRRDASYPDLGDRIQSRGTVGLFYTALGNDHFGAFDWR